MLPNKLLVPLTLAFAMVLAGCHHDAGAPSATDTSVDGADATPLPKPAPASGPVTGMPSRPGPGPVGPPASTTVAEPALPSNATLANAAADTGASGATTTGTAPGAAPENATAEPTADDAVAVVRGYFSAIAGRDFVRAHALEGGDASGHSLAQLAGDYADVAAVEATIGAPGRLDAAAGSRYLGIPVGVVRSLRGGNTERMAGTVTLRRSVVDGATAEQRAWRIASVDLRPAPSGPPAQ